MKKSTQRKLFLFGGVGSLTTTALYLLLDNLRMALAYAVFGAFAFALAHDLKRKSSAE
jgi:hypothetical protein